MLFRPLTDFAHGLYRYISSSDRIGLFDPFQSEHNGFEHATMHGIRDRELIDRFPNHRIKLKFLGDHTHSTCENPVLTYSLKIFVQVLWIACITNDGMCRE